MLTQYTLRQILQQNQIHFYAGVTMQGYCVVNEDKSISFLNKQLLDRGTIKKNGNKIQNPNVNHLKKIASGFNA